MATESLAPGYLAWFGFVQTVFIIERHVAPGTCIVSDQWAAYRNIPNWIGFNYVHETVNHEQNFVDPITGAHTQRIEAHWGHVKD